jgi:three-Cys-motif partner protein
MTDSDFFDEQSSQSKVKADIVSKYFWAWAKIIINSRARPNSIAYVDLFAGKGRYEDGAKSTPLLILAKIASEKDIQDRLLLVFNDINPEYTDALQIELANANETKLLRQQPIVFNEAVGPVLLGKLGVLGKIPIFSFIDPWGYKGLSLELIGSLIANWGSDCIFFFNYNRIQMDLYNPLVKEHMDGLFGSERAELLRTQLAPMRPGERELEIVQAICQALRDTGAKYVLPFRFRDEQGARTTHHLIFVSKSNVGFGIMKKIMAGASSRSEQGVAVFEYNPVDERYPLLMELTPRLDELKRMLLNDFAGRRLSKKQIYESHQSGTLYTDKNYREALRQLEAEERIKTSPSATNRPKRKGLVTFADDVVVEFPPRGEISHGGTI